VVNAKTEWFTLRDARLQMVPYTRPSVEMAVTSMGSTSGAIAAGRYGMGILQFQSVGLYAMTTLPDIWALVQETAKANNQTVDRSKWRLVLQVHLAESREQALKDCRFGFAPWVEYFRHISSLPVPPAEVTGDALPQAFIDAGTAVIGTPDDAIAAINRHLADTGGFGCVMLLAHNWANSRATAESYELFARYVMPHFEGLNVNREASIEWVKQHHAAGSWQR
jgi:limonene 1,2-monooxygenase